MQFTRNPINNDKLYKYGDKIFIKFYKPITLNTNEDINIQPYEPHQGYIKAYQNSIHKPNLFRFTSIEQPNMIMIEQCEYMGKNENNKDTFDLNNPKFITHQYFKGYKVSNDKLEKFEKLLPKNNPNSKKYIRVEFAGQCYYIGENTEFKVDENTNYIVERKFNIVNDEIIFETDEYQINNKVKI